MSIKNSISSLYYWFFPISPSIDKIDFYLGDYKVGFANKIYLSHNYHKILDITYIDKKYVRDIFSGNNYEYLRQSKPIKLIVTHPIFGVKYENVWINGGTTHFDSGAYVVFFDLGFDSNKPIRNSL